MLIVMEEIDHLEGQTPGMPPYLWPTKNQQSTGCTTDDAYPHLGFAMETASTGTALCDQKNDDVHNSVMHRKEQHMMCNGSDDLHMHTRETGITLSATTTGLATPNLESDGTTSGRSSSRRDHQMGRVQNSLQNLTALIRAVPSIATVCPGTKLVTPSAPVKGAEIMSKRHLWTSLMESLQPPLDVSHRHPVGSFLGSASCGYSRNQNYSSNRTSWDTDKEFTPTSGSPHDDFQPLAPPLNRTDMHHTPDHHLHTRDTHIPHSHTHDNTTLDPKTSCRSTRGPSVATQSGGHGSDLREKAHLKYGFSGETSSPLNSSETSASSARCQKKRALPTESASVTRKSQDSTGTSVSIPNAVNLLKTMQKALEGLTKVSDASKVSKCNQPPQTASTLGCSTNSVSHNVEMKPKPLCSWQPTLADDELPDLDDPIQPQCACVRTFGHAVVMCQACRLSSYEPPRKLKKERHFLDVLSTQTDDEQMCEENSGTESESSIEEMEPGLGCVVQDRQSFAGTSDSDTDVDEAIQTILCTHKSRVIRGTTRNVEQEISANARMVTQKLSKTPSYCSVPFHSELLMVADNKRLKPFPVLKIAEPRLNIIEGVQEEAAMCDGLTSHVVKLVRESVTIQFEPPDELIRSLFITLTDSRDISLSYSIYNTLETLFKIHPPNGTIPFTWSDLENVIAKLRLPYGVKNIEPCEAISNILALRLIVSCLETDLRNRSLASQLRMIKSAAYKWMSTDLIFSNVKQLIQWITLALRYGDFEDQLVLFKRLTPLSTRQGSPCEDVPKVLPCLQKLLDISVTIAKRPDDSARRISIELVHMFRCLPSLHARHLFLTTITSPLLKFTLCQHLLEDQCGVDSCGAQCLQDILQADFKAKPPRNSLTPPPTPSDDDDDDDYGGGGGGGGGHRNRRQMASFQDEGWEELTLLLFTVVSSYLATVKAGLRCPLWKRVLDQPQEVLSASDRKTLKRLPEYVTKLKSRVESDLAQMSTRTGMYLLQLECLADLQ